MARWKVKTTTGGQFYEEAKQPSIFSNKRKLNPKSHLVIRIIYMKVFFFPPF